MAIEEGFQTLEIVALIILVGLVSAQLARRFNVPVVIPLLFAGATLGSFGLGLLDPAQSGVSLSILTFLFIPVLLFGESMLTDLAILKSVSKSLLMLITVGLLITALGVTAICQYLFHIPFYTALLIGAIVAATDPVVIIPLLKHLRVDKRISTLITAESSLNDAAAIVLTLIVISILQGGTFSFVTSLSMFIRLFFGGALIGSFATITLLVLINRFKLGEQIIYLSMVIFIVAYASAEIFSTSGVTACVFAGLILGTELKSLSFHLLQREKVLELWENFMFLSESAIFIILGTYLSLELLQTNWLIAMTITLGLFFVIRPLAVFLSTAIEDHLTLKEKFFVSWVGAKGAVPAGLAATVLGLRVEVEYSAEIFTIVLSLVVFTIVLISFTAKPIAKKTLTVKKDTSMETYQSMRSRLIAKYVALKTLEDRYRELAVEPMIYEKMKAEYRNAIKEFRTQLDTFLTSHSAFTGQLALSLSKDLVAIELSSLSTQCREGKITTTFYENMRENYSVTIKNMENELVSPSPGLSIILVNKMRKFRESIPFRKRKSTE